MNPTDAHILAPWSPATDSSRRQETAWAWGLAERDWPVEPVACTNPADYETAVRNAWSGTLLVWEQDIVPTSGQVDRLFACPYPVCAQAYPLYLTPLDHPTWTSAADALRVLEYITPPPPHLTNLRERVQLWREGSSAVLPVPFGSGGRRPVCVHRIGPPGRTHWLRWGQRWAHQAGLGLTKFATSRLPASLDWEPGDWITLDSRISRWLYRHRIPIHIHWGLAVHHHHCPCHREEEDASCRSI